MADEERFYSPRDFVEEVELKDGMYIADFGSGTGNFAVEMARHVGQRGRVYAFDIRRSALQALRGKMRSHGLNNIQPVRADLEQSEGTGLSEKAVDMVLIHNIIFQVEDKAALLKEAMRILKPDGHVLAVEWEKSSPIGPPKDARLSKEELIQLFEQYGLRHERTLKAGKYHYGVAFQT